MAGNHPRVEVGARVARARKRRGLTQQGLAQKTSYARSHIAQVETGRRAATPAFIVAAADALRVDPAELYGQPFRGDTPSTDRVHATIAVELGDWEEAARRSADVTDAVLRSVSRERQAHHRIDTARAHRETGRHKAALRELLAADRAAPQMTRFHPVAKIVASHLAARYRQLPEALRILMARMRI